jgi:Fic family protein
VTPDWSDRLAEDLPIYSDSIFRGSDPFPALKGVRDDDIKRCLERFDEGLDHGEGAMNVARALEGVGGVGREDLLGLHRRLFEGRPGAGELRSSPVEATFRGQDCPDPRFLAQSLDNFEKWLGVESLSELHPIQQAALTTTRLVDIWPFEFGNRTTAVVFANSFLLRAGLPPFFVPVEQLDEFDQILSQAIMMQTESLVRAIYRCIERELERARE